MKLVLRYGGDMHKPGPPLHPTPFTLLLDSTADLRNCAIDSIERRDLVKLIEFLIEEGVDVNAVDHFGFTPFMNCAIGGARSCVNRLLSEGLIRLSSKVMEILLFIPLSIITGLMFVDTCWKIAGLISMLKVKLRICVQELPSFLLP
jgi:hypothetical protein